jgi:MFS family permease
MTLGRSLGGPIGGVLTDSIGWRWCVNRSWIHYFGTLFDRVYRLFFLQAPLTLLAALLVSVKLHLPQTQSSDGEEPSSSHLAKLKRIDFLGIFTLATSILSGMFLLQLGGHEFAWNSPIAVILAITLVVFGILFVLTEAYVATEPIFSLHLLRIPDVVLSYLINVLQMVAQTTLMFFVPLYFQVTKRASATDAGLHLVPAVVGNAIGGVLAGTIIKRTGQYKGLLLVGSLIAASSYVLIILRWKGSTGFGESLYIFPAGLGTGLVQASVFVSMTAAIKPSEIAMVLSGVSLILSVGFVGGVTTSSLILDTIFEKNLRQRLSGPGAEKVICGP